MTRLRRIAEALARFNHSPTGDALGAFSLFVLLFLLMWGSVPFTGGY